jgi:hypothetical protein
VALRAVLSTPDRDTVGVRSNKNRQAHHRNTKLEAMHSVMEEPELKLRASADIRWLSFHSAIHALYHTYGSVVTTLLQEVKLTKNATASGLHKFFTTYLFCAFLCLLVYVLNVLTETCKTLQTRELLYSYVKPKIAIAIGELSGMKVRLNFKIFRESVHNCIPRKPHCSQMAVKQRL